MRKTRLARAAPVRYALLFAAFSCLLMGAVLAVIYWWMSSLLARHLDLGIEAQLQVLRADFEQDGPDSMLGLVREHEKHYRESPLHFLVRDASGAVLAGDLASTEAGEGWHDIRVDGDGDGDEGARLLRGRGEWFTEDLFVLVTNDTRDLRETRHLILTSYAIALASTVILALGGGLVVGGALLRRVDAVNRTARAIVAGDLSRRIPMIGPGDELGGLAEVLNEMLARIEELMANVRHVTSDIAHDLRTPLGHQRQRLEAALDRPLEPAGYRAVIEAAIEETDTMLRTFEAMLRIAQVEAGARRVRFAPVDLGAVAENVADAFAAVAEDGGRRLEARIDEGVLVRGDRDLLTQVLVNLIENGLRHTPPGTTLWLEARAVRGRARLVVADDGPGIPEDERSRVLRRFYRLDASRSTPGSGLGLSLVAAVTRLHAATIALADNRPGLRVSLDFATERAAGGKSAGVRTDPASASP